MAVCSLVAAITLLWVGSMGAAVGAPAGQSTRQPSASGATRHAVPSLRSGHVKDSGLGLSPVFSQTLTGDFTQAGNTLFDCDRLTNGQALPAGGCVRNVNTAVGSPSPSRPFYNNQIIQKNLDRDSNPDTDTSSSATVNVPLDAKVVFADLMWLGTSQKDANPNIVWNPNIYTEPMKLSVNDDQHYQSIVPDRGTSIQPGSPASDTNDYYYTASSDITPLLAGRSGQITLWGADAPFPENGFNQASLGWDVVVVYQYPNVDLAAGHVGKQITIQNGFVYQKADAPATNAVVQVPAITDPTHVEIGVIAGEGDSGLTGDTFAVNGTNIAQPVTGQTNNFFVSNAQGATNPNWTSNFATDNVVLQLAPGIVNAGDTKVTLTTQTSGDGFMLRGLASAIPVPSIGLDKEVPAHYTTVGADLPYTFTVTNTSGVPLHNLSVTDPNLGGTVASCNHPGVLAPTTSYQCMATHTITRADIAAGKIVNTATAHGLGQQNEALTATASATSTTSTEVAITKTGDPKPVHAGDPFTYTLTVTNLGAADAANVVVTDPLPEGLVNPQATASGDVTVNIANGTLTATEPVLGHTASTSSFTVTVTGTIASPFTGGTAAHRVLTNTATVQAPNTNCTQGSDDPLCSATDQTTVLQPEITINKVTDNTQPKPGDTFEYTVFVRNRSLTTTATATVSDPIPPPLTDATWTCSTTTTMSTCGTTTGTGDITDVPITLEPGAVAVFHITVTVPGDFQGGTIVNTATATPTGSTLCAEDLSAATCSDDVPVTSTPDPALLVISKSHAPVTPAPIPGAALTYTVTVTNPSPATIAHATFDDPVPTGIQAAGSSWTTAVAGTGTTVSPASGTGFPTGQTITMTIDPGGSVTFTISTHVDAGFTGTDITNTASATPGANTGCADGAPTCEADDTFTVPARLVITKSHTPTSPDPVPGSTVTYTVIVTNPGNGTGHGTLSDPLPAELDAATATWTCTSSGAGSACGPPTSGTGSPDSVPIAVAAAGNVTFTITATILASPEAVHITNTASITPGANTLCEDGQPTCEATDEFTSTPDPATLLIDKAHAPASPVQGESVTYTITVTNTSATTRAEGTVTDDPFSPALTDVTWTAEATAGSSVGTASGSGPIVAVPVVIAVGGGITFTVHATVRADWPGGDVVNTAAVTPGANTLCDPANDSACSADTVFPTPSLITIAKFHEPTAPPPKPSQQVVYLVRVTNLSYLQPAQVTLDDPLPPQVERATASWTTAVTGDGTTVTPNSGTGPPAGVALTIGPEGTVTFTIVATIRSSFTGGEITNTATATPGEATACRSGDPTCDASTSFNSEPNPAELVIAKTYKPHQPTIQPGTAVTYTVTVTNTSTTTTGHGTVSDPAPDGLSGIAWSATATSGSHVTPTSGSGPITGAEVTVAPGGRVTFTITAIVDSPFTGTFDITNIATLAPGLNTTCAPTNRGQGCNAAAVFHVPTATAPAHAGGGHPPLPFTGLDAVAAVRVALLLLLSGLALLWTARREETLRVISRVRGSD